MKSQIQFEELYKLISSHNYSNSSFLKSFDLISQAISNDMAIYRASIWLYRKDAFENLRYMSSELETGFLHAISAKEFPVFFENIRELPQSAVNAVHINEFKDELKETFFYTDDIKSFAWVHVHIKGKFIGFLMVESKSHRVWKQQDLLYLIIAANHLGHLYNLHLAERKKENLQSTKLFEENSLPVFLCDLKTKRILGANSQVEKQYGFSVKELTGQDFWALGPIHEIIKDAKGQNQFFKGTHSSKLGREFNVKIAAFPTQHLGKKVWACIVIDQQEESRLSNRNEELYNRLADHAFFTSHNIRGPLANILGLIDLIPHSWDDKRNYEEIIYRLKIQAVVLEETIRVMAAKVELD